MPTPAAPLPETVPETLADAPSPAYAAGPAAAPATPDTDQGQSEAPRRPDPRTLLQVAEGIKHLEPEQLNRLTVAFDTWAAAGRDVRTRRSRQRMRLVFLLLRFTGARLGEVLALDETRDLDPAHSVVLLSQGTERREVALPAFLVEQVRSAQASDNLGAARGQLLHLDQGFVRRKFLEQAAASGLPRELLNPRVLRASRAIELLRGGLPLRAVQAMLGHATAAMTASYVTVREADLHHVARHYILRETSLKTSARNTFVGEVTTVRHGDILSEVEVTTAADTVLAAIITNESMEHLGIVPGKTVTAMVKAPWVLVEAPTAGAPGQPARRNHFVARIGEVRQGEVASEIMARTGDGALLCALLSSRSWQELGLAVGDLAVFRFKTFSVILNTA